MDLSLARGESNSPNPYQFNLFLAYNTVIYLQDEIGLDLTFDRF